MNGVFYKMTAGHWLLPWLKAAVSLLESKNRKAWVDLALTETGTVEAQREAASLQPKRRKIV